MLGNEAKGVSGMNDSPTGSGGRCGPGWRNRQRGRCFDHRDSRVEGNEAVRADAGVGGGTLYNNYGGGAEGGAWNYTGGTAVVGGMDVNGSVTVSDSQFVGNQAKGGIGEGGGGGVAFAGGIYEQGLFGAPMVTLITQTNILDNAAIGGPDLGGSFGGPAYGAGLDLG